jgi:photosystem II P680 reaction center D1 protein
MAEFKSNTWTMHGSLLTSSLLAESYGDVSLNIGYNFGQEDEAYISAAHGF